MLLEDNKREILTLNVDCYVETQFVVPFNIRIDNYLDQNVSNCLDYVFHTNYERICELAKALIMQL